MHYYSGWNKCICFLYFLIIILIALNVDAEIIKVTSVSDDLISDLYSKYKEAAEDDAPDSMRRLFAHNRQYRIHVRKLQEVNGLKTHNLMIKEEIDSKINPLIYINNPVEAKFPNAYLTLEEFKQALINRVQVQRQLLTKQSKFPFRASKKSEVKTSKLLIDKYTKIQIYSKTTNKIISSTKLYNSPIIKSTPTKLTSITNRNITNQPQSLNITKSKPSIPPKTSTVASFVVSNQNNGEETNRSTESLRNYAETSTEVTAFTESLVTNSTETFNPTDSRSTIKQSTKNTPENFTEEQTTEETATTETTTETVQTEATRKTRRTLGRPLVFMGSNK